MTARIVEFDIDGTLTEDIVLEQMDKSGSYIYRKPNFAMIDLVRSAYQVGWTIIINTGRREEQRRITESWLAQHNVPYHYLFMGKPACRYRIDDVNIAAGDFAKVLASENAEWEK